MLPFQIYGLLSRPNSEARKLLPRGLALFLGGFALLNILGGLRSAHFDANIWWIDLRTFPTAVVTPFLLVSSACLVGFAVWPPRSAWGRFLIVGCVGVLGMVAVANTAQFYVLLARGVVRPGIPIPLSLFVSAALAIILVAAWRKSLPRHKTSTTTC
jgi:hypothetical protein